ncbi:GNAT family N-acetyltransferase [Hyphomicrobium sp. CS1GBMeth3]|uniref:GNAT family N-acetyltransferase n=1 Tax=Hyphomicrobium sp. CS1GBMeth3 TaxID=1892845 RepID=UPI000931543D|nr:GNAT family N-acetyltransferase [Hyphomicrobium sp. CS1GBMeth3]
MTAISIRKETTSHGGRYAATVEGKDGEAELTFTVRAADVISADHTEAPDTLRGTGVALALVEHLIADARAKGFKVIPLCPYVQAQYKKHPEWNDVIANHA